MTSRDDTARRGAATRLAARVWEDRRRVELEAAARFERLARELARHGAAAPVVALTEQASADEHRHAEQCAALVHHFGGETLAAPAIDLRPAAPRGLSPKEQLLYEVVALCCVTETLSVALLGALSERATDPFARQTMHAILKDEVDHARIGWAHLADARARGARDVVGPHLPAILRATVEEELFVPGQEHPLQAELGGLGSLSRAERLRLFEETMRAVTFPGLSRFGIDASLGEQWLAEQLKGPRRARSSSSRAGAEA